jgi:RNA polymerase sigma-70 factor (ECF subfamily)
MIDDDKIIEGCKAGKKRAQSRLYKKYAPAMLGVCLRYCSNMADAEDVLQEGFIKVFNYIKNFRGEGSFEGWIRRIMVNTALTHIKKNTKYSFEDIENIPSNYQEEEDVVYAPVSPEVLIEVIQSLPDGYRSVVNLHIFEGYPHKEIAGIMGISESTSKSQLSKAKKFLRKKLEEKNKVLTTVTENG